MLKYATSISPWNIKFNDQHLFLPLKATTNVAQSTNNNLNQLQTKVNTRKQRHMKSYALKNDLQNENKMK
jgi:hypothetical protein